MPDDSRQPSPVDSWDRLNMEDLLTRLWNETMDEMKARGIYRMPIGPREMAQWIIKYHPTKEADNA